MLLGDSAHSIHPLAGQGFNLTIRGIQKIFKYAKAEINESKDIGQKKYLLNYSKSHYLDATLLIQVTDKLNLIFSNSNFFLRSLRRKGLYFLVKAVLLEIFLKIMLLKVAYYLLKTINFSCFLY